jgi:hypothetical protein
VVLVLLCSCNRQGAVAALCVTWVICAAERLQTPLEVTATVCTCTMQRDSPCRPWHVWCFPDVLLHQPTPDHATHQDLRCGTHIYMFDPLTQATGVVTQPLRGFTWHGGCWSATGHPWRHSSQSPARHAIPYAATKSEQHRNDSTAVAKLQPCSCNKQK